MTRQGIVNLSVTLAFGLALMPGAALGQQKPLKEQIVGAWTLVSAVDTQADGTKTNPWGANPKGTYMFDANGRFTQMLLHTDLPKIDNRMGGTPDQNKAIAQGVIAMYGTYTVDEASKTIVGSLRGQLVREIQRHRGQAGRHLDHRGRNADHESCHLDRHESRVGVEAREVAWIIAPPLGRRRRDWREAAKQENRWGCCANRCQRSGSRMC